VRMEVKKPPLLAALAILLAGLILFELSDTSISFADTSAPNNEATSSISKASNSSASATIMITMYTLPSE
jgi:hypothetical protein